MIAFADLIFDAVKGFIGALGALFTLLGAGLFLYITYFANRSVPVLARVISHTGHRTETSASGDQRKLYRARFEVEGGPHAGACYTSHEVQSRNAYPIGTLWPARFDAKGGAIRTERALSTWPGLCAIMVITGIAMIIVPNMPAFDGDKALGLAFIAIGIAVCSFGIAERATAIRRRERSVPVEASLIAIEIAYDTERHEYEMPVLGILSGEYESVECANVSMGVFEQSDIGVVMPADFDPYTGQLTVTSGRFAAPPSIKPMLLTGAIFTAIGAAINSGLF